MVAIVAAGEFLVIVVLGSLLFAQAGHNHAANLAGDERAYEKWVNGFATGLGHRPAVVILEPDALAQLNNCANSAQQQARLQMLSYAVKTLQSNSDQVYLDAGHSNWVPAGEMARRLRAADVAQASGFALNVANYDATNREIAYAAELDRNLGMAKRFVVDTSRNGQGSSGGQAPPGLISRALPGAGSGTHARQLFTDPNSEAANWVRDNPGDPLTREITQRIANQPTAKWFGPWSGDITSAVSGYASVASKQSKVPILVAYDIPQLGCAGNRATGSKQWCNPPGHQLGSVPQALDGGGDMGLWIKAPGESDGNCGTGVGTKAGEFSPAVAKDLISGRS
jgi:cellulase/cellobiase CelA1